MRSSIRPRIVNARCNGLSMSPFRQDHPATASAPGQVQR
jgi:hypothetical protein